MLGDTKTSMKPKYRCPCGAYYKHINDDEAAGIPPSFTARFFFCRECGVEEWLEAEDFGWDEWPNADEDLG